MYFVFYHFGLVFVLPPLTKIKRLSTVLSGMDSGAKPQRILTYLSEISKHFRKLFCKILDFLIDIKIKPLKLLILEQ